MLEVFSKYSSSHDLLENIFGSSRPWCGQYSEVLAFSHRENLACRYSPNIPFDCLKIEVHVVTLPFAAEMAHFVYPASILTHLKFLNLTVLDI